MDQPCFLLGSQIWPSGFGADRQVGQIGQIDLGGQRLAMCLPFLLLLPGSPSPSPGSPRSEEQVANFC